MPWLDIDRVQPDHRRLRAELRALVCQHQKLLFGNVARHGVPAHERDRPPGRERVVREASALHRRSFHEVLERARNDGQVDPDIDPDLIIDLLVGPLWTNRLVGAEPLTTDTAAAVVDRVLYGIGRSSDTDER